MSVEFALNGQKVSLPAGKVDPRMSLNEFVRRHSPFTGTKLSCGEGGCGACAVDIARKRADGSTEHLSVNSCLRSVASMHGWSVTTTEGLGSIKKGLHPVQERIVGFNGTQCGFCTPGMVMTMYSTLKSGEPVTMANVEQRLDGNLCRCTGYRPILDACKSLASDSNVTDHVCGNADKLPPYDASKDPPFPSFVEALKAEPLECASEDGTRWLRATSLGTVFETLAAHPAPGEVKLIVGNTCHGIYKEDPARVFVDLQYLEELREVRLEESGVTVGAAASITALHQALLRAVEEKPARARTLTPLAKHVLRVANVHVRNAGSVGGNLAMAKTRGFLSDLSTILLGIESTVTLVSANGPRTVTMEEFLASATFDAGELIHSIRVPFDADDVHFLTYKAALRAQNSHAYVNAALKARVVDGTIASANFAVGGVMRDDEPGSHAVLAKAAAAAAVGKKVGKEAADAVLAAVKSEVVPHEANHDRDYRTLLISGFFYKFMVALMGDAAPAAAASAPRDVTLRAPSRGSQSFSTNDEHGIVSQPVVKISAPAQASGEARFTDDIPVHANAVFAAPVLATVGRGKLLRIDASAALALPGVVAFVSAADIERLGGKNNCSPLGQNQTIFVQDAVSFHGQPLGVVVAESDRLARRAAKLVRAEYDTEGKKAVTSIAAALAEPEEFGTPIANEHVVGDPAAALASAKRVVQGVVEMGEQKHFYMEPQVAYAVPDEDGCITVYYPNQWPDAAQSGVATALGLPMNKVNVVHRRAGGGFGGKLTHAILNASMTSVAALTVNRPVRMALDRNTDMRVCGGREEMRTEYKVAFEDDGKIVALDADGVLNAGWLIDLTWFTSFAFASAMNEAYGIPNIRSSSRVVLTNLPPRTVVRGPGEIEASYLMETVIEHVAHETGLSPNAVRARNFYDNHEEAKVPNGNPVAPYTIPTLWEQLQAKAKADERQAAVDEFNRTHRWKKRGLSCTPVRYEVGVWQKNALVNVYGTDGTVLITHSGSEIGQGLNTKVAQAAALALGKLLGLKNGIPLSKIRFGDIQTNVLPNASFTGGSTGSEGTAMAVMRCCDTITERMKPVVDELRAKKEGDDTEVTWEEACAACKGANVNLSAQDHWSSSGEDALHYQNYGVALSTVELDVITGEVNVLSTNLMYDCGKSLNPAIDIGQCEGAFLMGVGYYLRERVLIGENGECESDGTWEYKPPGVRDVPEEFTVELLHDTRFEKGILSSKSSGEPPLVLATSVMMAVRNAIRDARREAGLSEWFDLPVPCTPADIQKAAAVDPSHFSLE